MSPSTVSAPATPTPARLFSSQALKKLIIPLIIEQALAITVGLLDTVMISVAGEAAVSGVSLIDMLNTIFINVFSSLATGGAVIAAQYTGAKRPDLTQSTVQQLLAVSLSIASIVMAVLLIFRSPIVRLLYGTIEQDVWDNAMTYLLVTVCSFPLLSLYNASAALFRAVGNSKVSMNVSIVANIINFCGNAFFLFVCHWGVFGVALATLISRFAAMTILLVKLVRDKDSTMHLDLHTKFRPNWRIIKQILHIGIPNALENCSFTFGKVIVMSLVSSFGTASIAANAIGNNLAGLGCIPGQALNLAMLTVVGQCVGAKDEVQVRYYMKKLLKIAYLVMAVLNALILISLPLILKIYNVSPEAISYAKKLVWIHNGLAILFWPSSFVLPSALRAGGDVRFTMLVSMISMFAFRVALSYVFGLALHMGVVGVWLAMVVDWCGRDICFVIRACGHKWLDRAIATKIEN